MKSLPLWNLSALYPSLDSPEFQNALDRLTVIREEIQALEKIPPRRPPEEPVWIEGFIRLYNRFYDLFDELYAFVYMHFSTATSNYRAINLMNRLDEIRVPVASSLVAFRNVLAGLATSVADCLAASAELKQYSFFIGEQLLLRAKQMSREEEELAMDLMRSGGQLWERLQETVSSTLSTVWDRKKKTVKTVTQLRSLASDPNRSIREKAFRRELELWESMKVPLAFSLNGVKGFSVTLNKRRRYQNTLERSLFQARINRQVLESLVASMRDALPDFRRYFKAKARLLKVPKLAFFDLFAPLPGKPKKWSFQKAHEFILEQFGSFSEELAGFARRSFDDGWIDAEPRAGKVGGAYCISLPLRRESRVLCNFNETFSAVTTVAHELGHAYHHHVLSVGANASAIHRDYPMTLAETASIFSENLVFDGALRTFPGPEKTDALEHFLQDAAQIIVDILSRFLFESRLMDARAERELSADELCALMTEAQKETYGDALEEKNLHPYMWAVKGHYYRSELAFYNYPYAFGMLFGLALFSRFKEEGQGFPAVYKSVLEKSGRMTCPDLTKELGFDIETKAFWESGINLIRGRIDEFEKIAEGKREDKER